MSNNNRSGKNYVNAKKDKSGPNSFLENSGIVKAIRSNKSISNNPNRNRFNKNNTQNNSSRNTQNNNFRNTQNNNFNKNNNTTNLNLNLEDYSDIITEIINEFNKRNLDKLHRLDEKLLEEAVMKNNKDLIELTIIAYSFRKLMSKKHILYNPKWNSFSSTVTNDLVYASSCFREKKMDDYRKAIQKVQKNIQNTDRTLGHFIHNLVDNARTKLASSAYAYGMSLSQATNLLSAQKENVMEMVGTTKISDEDKKIKSIKERVNYLQTALKKQEGNIK